MLLKDRRIFYVEDDLKNRAIVQMILEREGAVVGFERWGKEDTLIRLQAFAPVDLILLDLMFPHGVTGYDVFKAIRGSFETVPVLAVSASDPTVEIPKLRPLGFAGFISKPIDLYIFPQQVASVINGQAIWS